MKSSLTRIFLILIALCASVQAYAAPGVRLRLEAGRGRNTVAVGQNFYISIEVSDLNAAPEQPKSVPGAKVLYFARTGSSSSFTSVNGRTTQSTSSIYTLTLRAEKEGSFSFGPIMLDGHKSNTLSYVIGKPESPQNVPQNLAGGGGTAAAGADPDKPRYIGKGDGNLFLKANVSKTTAYEQEALVYTVKLYSTYSAIKFIGATSAPKFDGFVVEESKDISTQLSVETYNGKQYATAIIARYIIFPQMSGDLKVTGNTYTVSVDEREYYHDSYFGNISVSRPLQLNVTPNDLTVKVKPLPQPQPADFSGGVGSFSFSSSLPTANLSTNNAASIVYAVNGSGNLKYIKLPDLNAVYPPELEVYSPEADVQAKVGSSNVSGSVHFDYTLMPLEEGQYKIPPVTLVYFNPATGTYERSTAQGYTVNVARGKASAKSQSRLGVAFDARLMPVVAPLGKEHEPMVYGFAYWLWYIIPSLLFVGAVVYYRKRLKELSDMASLRSRKAGALARRRLRKAAAAMKSGKTELFYEEILKAIWGYLGDKLKMPTSELSRDNVKGELDKVAVDADVIGRVLDIIDECEFARYSPSDKAAGMKPLYDRTAEAIGDIDRSIGRKPAAAPAKSADPYALPSDNTTKDSDNHE